MKTTTVAIIGLALSSACAENLDPNADGVNDTADASNETDDNGDQSSSGGELDLPSSSGAFVHEVLEDGSTVTTLVDATDKTEFQSLDLETGLSGRDNWDLKYKRYYILSNGGVSGDAETLVSRLEGVEFEDVTQAPETGWQLDMPDGDDTDSEADNLFVNGDESWYNYEFISHTLSPKDFVYCVATAEGSFYKFVIEDYYDAAGTPAFLQFRWAEIEGVTLPEIDDSGAPSKQETTNIQAPSESELEGVELVEITAKSEEEWVHFSIADGIVDVSTPESSLAWDLAFRRSSIRTNSGKSGAGQGGALKIAAADLEYGLSQPSGVRAVDEEVVERTTYVANPLLNSWYDYDTATNNLTPKDEVYWVTSANGSSFLLEVLAYESGKIYFYLVKVGAATSWSKPE